MRHLPHLLRARQNNLGYRKEMRIGPCFQVSELPAFDSGLPGPQYSPTLSKVGPHRDDEWPPRPKGGRSTYVAPVRPEGEISDFE